MPRTRTALLAVPLLLLLATGCEDVPPTDPEASPGAPGTPEPQDDEDAQEDEDFPETAEVEEELMALPSVAWVDASKTAEDYEVYYGGLEVRMETDADQEDVVTVLERAEELGAEKLQSFTGGTMAVEAATPLRLEIGPPGNDDIDEESAEDRVERLFLAGELFDRPVTAGHEYLAIATDGEPVTVVDEIWEQLASESDLGAERVAVGTEEGSGSVRQYNLSSADGADEITLDVWDRALAALSASPRAYRPTAIDYYGPADPDVFPTSRLMTAIRVRGERPSYTPAPRTDPAVRRLVLDLVEIGRTMEPDSSYAVGTAPYSSDDFVSVYTGSRLADDPVDGTRGWVDFVRPRLPGGEQRDRGAGS